MAWSTGSIRRRAPLRGLGLASLAVVGTVAILARERPERFRPYFGDVPPTLAAALVCLAGIVALQGLRSGYGMRVFDREVRGRDRLLALVAATPFMVSVTIADLFLGFPADINVEMPAAFAFYPAMGTIAQISLHVVPFAVVLALCGRGLRSWPAERRLMLAIFLASLVESGFQIAAVSSTGALSPLDLFVAVQLFLFGIVELLLYWRLDFLTMVLFRLTYYAYWHLVWASMR